MKKLVFVLALLSSASVIASDATVVSTEPVYTTTTEYRQVCVPVTQIKRSIGGTLLGGAIGAVVGNQVGGGSGRDIATAVGAVTGAVIGQNASGDRVVTTNQCTNEPFTVQQISQYKLTVDINGSYYTVYRGFNPGAGSIIPVTLTVN